MFPTKRAMSQFVSTINKSYLSTFKIGDKIPVNFIKDKADPVFMQNDQYPDWVHGLHVKVHTCDV